MGAQLRWTLENWNFKILWSEFKLNSGDVICGVNLNRIQGTILVEWVQERMEMLSHGEVFVNVVMRHHRTRMVFVRIEWNGETPQMGMCQPVERHTVETKASHSFDCVAFSFSTVQRFSVRYSVSTVCRFPFRHCVAPIDFDCGAFFSREISTA